MKKLILFALTALFIFTFDLSAQFRDDLPPSHDFSGEIVNYQSPSVMSGLENFFRNNMEMSHSYSMNFSSFAGNYQNVNAYTNTMEFFFTPKLYGRLDVSLFHSPFGGNSMMYSGDNDPEIMIRNAELNYKVNDNIHLQLQYQQVPSHYGFYNPYGYGRYNRFGHGYYY